MPVFFVKKSQHEPAVYFAGTGKRIGKSDPYFVDFAGGEKMVDDFDARAEEGGIGDVFVERVFGAFPEAVAFDVYADKIALRELLRQSDRVFAAAAGEFEGN